MRNIVTYISQNRYFLLFILLFAYVESIYTRLIVRQTLNIYIFTPEAAISSLFNAIILFLVLQFFIKKWQKSDVILTKELFKIFSISIVLYIVIMYVTGYTISFLFNTVERNFNRHTISVSFLSNIINGFIYGSFFLAYYYYHQNKQQQEKLINYNRALAESKINQLKSQLNPHFLFNNLNILDQLIEEDKQVASDFLNEFAEIYRYVLQGLDRKTILIEEEIEFAQQYFKLMQHKYGNAYLLNIENKLTNNLVYIVPLTLQLLIENAIKHNLGTLQNPVYISVEITDNGIEIKNNKILKQYTKTSSGKGINNLVEQYKILTENSITVENSDELFTIKIPLILKEHT
ncbi:sensor histidine kinase [Chishuiella changwenlii]|uniref:sensor histidine kinase n=1 Tax=Chishuiella changwenlii TaxID=1434701 RepID=UPI002FD9F46F